MNDINKVWLATMDTVLTFGKEVAPRNLMTKELLQHTIEMDMRKPVINIKERGLNYRFMAAEAYWILSGDDQVEELAQYNPRIAEFSDDGQRFFGAYGPKIINQLDYVVTKLKQDPMSRQAVINIWRECPPITKDVPCTVTMVFNIREGKLNMHVFMRSSDVWLGIPYDVFSFSMVAHRVCGQLNLLGGESISPGSLFLTAASSHMYQTNWNNARHLLDNYWSVNWTDATKKPIYEQVATPDVLHLDPSSLMMTLKLLRDTHPGDPLRWWE